MAKILNPVKSIRAKCLDCCAGQVVEVKLCCMEDCPLHPYRFGKNPYNKRTLTDEQRQALSDRMRALRDKQLSAS